jgi:glutamine synthetase
MQTQEDRRRQALDHAREADVRLVRFLYCGNDGTVRGKASSTATLESRLMRGIGISVGMQAMSGLDHLQPVPGLGPVGEVRLVPDPDTFTVLPYAPSTAALLCDHYRLDFEPWEHCPRVFLRRMAERLAERGAVLQATFENEFSLARLEGDQFVPVDRALCFSTIGMTASQDYVAALADALSAQRIPLEQYYAELGHGQQEISIAPTPALTAADQQVLVRETIRGVAAGKGLIASLAPKPWLDQAGNGTHIHFSAWQGQRNLFHEAGTPDKLSTFARQFMAGVLAHLPGLCGLTAPSFNSYHRIVPQFWAGAFTCWGHDNREAPLRVPSTYWGAEEASTNVELKACDASCNPYLALGGLIAAGIDGLERELEPPEAVDVDPASIPEPERERMGIRRLPQSQREALDALAGDEVLRGALGPLADSYLAVRYSEWADYSQGDERFEQQGHFLKY